MKIRSIFSGSGMSVEDFVGVSVGEVSSMLIFIRIECLVLVDYLVLFNGW